MSAAGFARYAPLEQHEIEGTAQFLLKLAHQDGADCPDVEAAAQDLGFSVVRAVVEGMRGWTDLDDLIVYCRPCREKSEEIWTIAHECGHIAQEAEGLPSEYHDEETTDRIARAILMPQGPYRKTLCRFGAEHPYVQRKYAHVPSAQRVLRAMELGFLRKQSIWRGKVLWRARVWVTFYVVPACKYAVTRLV